MLFLLPVIVQLTKFYFQFSAFVQRRDAPKPVRMSQEAIDNLVGQFMGSRFDSVYEMRNYISRICDETGIKGVHSMSEEVVVSNATKTLLALREVAEPPLLAAWEDLEGFKTR